MVRMRLTAPRAALGPLLVLIAAGCVATRSGGALGKQPVLQREQVVIPAFRVRGPLHPREGERVSAALRELLEKTPTHTALSGKVIRGAQKQFGIRSLDRASALRLATQLGAGMLALGDIEPADGGMRANVEFLDPRSGDRFAVQDVSGPDAKSLGGALFSALERNLEGVQLAATCRDEVAAGRFAEALAACDRALAIAPVSSVGLEARAGALLGLRRFREALEAHERALQVEPVPDPLVLGAGLAASGAGEREVAARYYDRFLARNPTQRLAVARRIAQVGEFSTAYHILEPGIAEHAANQEFARFLFTLSAAAGQATLAADGAESARPYYESALRAYSQLASPVAEPSLDDLRTLIAIHAALGKAEEALRIAQETILRHDTVAVVWSQYAATLAAVGRHPEAAAALTRAMSLDPGADDLLVRRARAHLDSGEFAEALADLAREAAGGGREAVATILFRQGAEAARGERFDEAVVLLEPAYEYAAPPMKQEIAFFLAFSLVKTSEEVLRATTGGSAPTGEALSGFRRAITLLRDSPNPAAPQVSAFAEQYIASLEAGRRTR